MPWKTAADVKKMAVACLQAEHEWFALRVRSRAEKIVSLHLESRGYRTLCPMYVDRRSYADRIKTVEAALFPGYLFCFFPHANRLPVLSSPGVESIVGFGRAHPVDLEEIQTLSAVMKAGVYARPFPFLKVGQKVRVESGPLVNLEGILVATKSRYRLVLSISLLQRSVVAEIDSGQIRPL